MASPHSDNNLADAPDVDLTKQSDGKRTALLALVPACVSIMPDSLRVAVR